MGAFQNRLTAGTCLVGALMLSTAAMTGTAAAQDLTVALPTSVNTLDPHNTATVGTDLSVISHLYTPLVIRGPDLALQPALATSWEAVDDLTWRFELRPGVTFVNGEPLDAEAVRWNIERVLDPDFNARVQSWFRPIEEVRVIDDTTLEIVTNAPYPALADQMSSFFLLPPQWTEAHNPAAEASSSGPYELVEFVSGDRIVLQANDEYWGEAPAFQTVEFRMMPEDSSRIAALLADEADFIQYFAPSEIDRINESGRAEASALSGIRFMMVKFNNLQPPFQGNPDLRMAINYAIDRQGIIDSLFNGLGDIANCQPLSPAYFGYNPDLEPAPYDPARARELMASAGYPDGLEVDLEVPLGRYVQAQEIAQVVAAMLAEIGVDVNIIEMEFGAWLDKYRNAGDLGDMSYLGQAWPTLDADGLLTLFEPGNAFAYYENEQFGELIREARSITDRDQRQDLYRQATQVMCEDPPHVPMFFQPTTYAISNDIEWQVRPDDWVRAFDMAPR